MILYEVNLRVNNDIARQFEGWLGKHIQDMLAIKGFINARCLLEEPVKNQDTTCWTVHYYLEDRESLQTYFDKHATEMRADGINRFGDQFSADRRIFEVLEMGKQ